MANCKTWGGPCVTERDLDEALLKAENESFCISQELTYYKLTHPTEFSVNKHLFRIRGLSEEEKISKLRCILSTEEDMSDNRMKVGQLPTDQNVLTALLATSGGEVHQSLVDSDLDLTQENIMSDSNDSNPDSEAAKVAAAEKAAAEKAAAEAAGDGNEVVFIEPSPTNFNPARMPKTVKSHVFACAKQQAYSNRVSVMTVL